MWALLQEGCTPGEEASKLNPCRAWEEGWRGLHLLVGPETTAVVAVGSQRPLDPRDNTGKRWRESAPCLQARASGTRLYLYPGCLS